MEVGELQKLQSRYRKLFSSEDGKAVKEHLEGYCFVRTPTIDDSSTRMAFNEGKRAVILHIETMLKMDFSKMAEAKKRRK